MKQPQSPTSPPPVNVWAKIPTVQAASIMDDSERQHEHHEQHGTDDVELKTSYSMKTSQSMFVMSSPTATAPSQLLNHTLDSSDWPSLSSDLPSLNHSLSVQQTTIDGQQQQQASGLPTSKSCGSFDTSGAVEDRKKQPIKWKPLIVEPPKRERRSYRGGFGRPKNSESGETRGEKSVSRSNGPRARSLDRKSAKKDETTSGETDKPNMSGANTNIGATRNKMVKSKSTSHRGFADTQTVRQTSLFFSCRSF